MAIRTRRENVTPPVTRHQATQVNFRQTTTLTNMFKIKGLNKCNLPENIMAEAAPMTPKKGPQIGFSSAIVNELRYLVGEQ